MLGLIDYTDRENQKIELLNLLRTNKITEEGVADYIIKLKLTEEEIQQLDEGLGKVLGAVAKGVGGAAKGVLKGGANLVKKGIVGGANLVKKGVVGTAKAAGNALVQQGLKTGIGQAVAQAVQPQQKQQVAMSQQEQQLAQNALTNLIKSMQKNPTALKLLQKFLPQLKQAMGLQ